MRYDYDMLGTPHPPVSMEAGERWMLNDVAGKPSAPGTAAATPSAPTYDALRRPLRTFVAGADPADRRASC